MTTRELRDLDNSELGVEDRNKSRSRSRSPPHNTHHKNENLSSLARSRLKNLSSQMRLTSQKPVTKPKVSVLNAFNQDSDDEPEVMPPEAKMRMKNIGRDTPTSSGPNSFGKTKHGFSDAQKLFEKSLKDAMDSALKDD